MSSFNTVTIIMLVGFGSYLWTSLFIFTRCTKTSPLNIISFFGTLSLAFFFLGNFLVLSNTEKEAHIFYSKLFWWANALPAAFWCHFGIIINRRDDKEKENLFPPTIIIAYTLCGVLIALTVFSDTIAAFSRIRFDQTENNWYVPPGDGYWLYLIFMAATMGSTVFRIWQAIKAHRQEYGKYGRLVIRQLWWVQIGSGFFLFSVMWQALQFAFQVTLSHDVGYLSLLLGLCFFGYPITQYHMLIEGKDIERDFLYSLAGALGLNFLYIAVLAFFNAATPFSVLGLMGITITSHSLLDWARTKFDRFFFAREISQARAEARQFVLSLASQPSNLPLFSPKPAQPTVTEQNQKVPNNPQETSVEDAPTIALDKTGEPTERTDKAFVEAIRKAIEGLSSQPQLAGSPLLSLLVVRKRLRQTTNREDNRLNRATALKDLLIATIERLRPTSPITNPTIYQDDWHCYSALNLPFVRSLTQAQALVEASRQAQERTRYNELETSELEQALLWFGSLPSQDLEHWQALAFNRVARFVQEEELQAILANSDLAESDKLSRISHYELLEEIGRGGMATVYRAKHASLNREVALKVISPQYSQDAEQIARFQREAQAAAGLHHPNILTVYDAGQDGDRYYIAMELLERKTLRDLAKSPLPLEQAATVISQIAAALQMAHNAEIIHRDVKPTNILLAKDGRAILSDFGIAKFLANDTSLTATGYAIGTPDYMSPEQIQSLPLDGRSDQYSLAVVLFQILTGVKPFQGANMTAVVLAHLHKPPPDPRQFRTDLPEEVVQILFKGLAKKPDERYPTVTEFAQAFAVAVGRTVAKS